MYSANIATRLKNNTDVFPESVKKICMVLDGKADNIVEFPVPKIR